jgi:molybdopterin synthase sulfur carrier subunit
MSTVKIITFGKLKEIVGSDFEENSDNTDELQQKLSSKFPALQTLKLRIAVNQKIISDNTQLNNNDVVALMPPYSGG